MPQLTIDGKEYEVPAGKTVLQVCLENQIAVPYFCYHDKLSVAGNCRMCLVEIEGRPKLDISCNCPIQDGMKVRTNSPVVLEARKSVLEFILINHPLDCPICDQAGECDLQDQYYNFSAVPYRFREAKQKKPKAVPLGDLVVLDDERCIVCTRCVRFCDEVAGVHELCVTERSDHSTITTYQDQGMKNAYSVNTVDICPVGALTNRDFRFNKRVWFLQKTPSICTGCATGCNIWLEHEQGIAYRYRPRENEAVNQCWMCDEGRLTYKFINAPDRITSPQARNQPSGHWERVSWAAALAKIHEALRAIPVSERGVVLSAQCSNEENQAWAWLAREAWGTPHVSATQREYPQPSEDAILRHADKNPNRAGVAALGVTQAYAPGAKLLFVLDTLREAEIAALLQQRPDFVVLLATNWGSDPDAVRWRPLSEARQIVERSGGANLLYDLRQVAPTTALPWVDLILPLASFAEQAGSFTNAKGLTQPFERAFPPKGETRSGSQIAIEIGALEQHVMPIPAATGLRRVG